MSKDNIELKDVIHLYLGCECMMTKNSYHAVHELGLSADTSFKLSSSRLAYFVQPTTRAEIKPILRKLDSMTEEENKEVKAVWFNESEKQDKVDIHVYAATTKYFLDKGFDIFNLIENNLAIDKNATT